MYTSTENKKIAHTPLSIIESPPPHHLHQAWLGFYNSHLRKLGDKPQLVRTANEMARC